MLGGVSRWNVDINEVQYIGYSFSFNHIELFSQVLHTKGEVLNYLLIILGILIGAMFTTQTGVNTGLRAAVGTPIQAAFVSFTVGAIILGVISLKTSNGWFKASNITNIPWWYWFGGALGAFNIATSIFLAPKLGALLLAVSVVCGQMLASLFYDQFGHFGFPEVKLNLSRFLGAVLVIAGVFLIAHEGNN